MSERRIDDAGVAGGLHDWGRVQRRAWRHMP